MSNEILEQRAKLLNDARSKIWCPINKNFCRIDCNWYDNARVGQLTSRKDEVGILGGTCDFATHINVDTRQF